MINKDVHIVCLDAPAPPDYGGAIDMYYKIISLANAGIKIHLHYFKYNNRDVTALKNYYGTINAYKRKGLSALSFRLPYIVSSRINTELINNLNKDDFPILIEGIHCAGILPYLKNKTRKVVLRVHNNEAVYYDRLAKAEKNIFKKFYFGWESHLLHRFQKKLPGYVHYACLSLTDAASLKELYQLPHVDFVACFTAWQKLNIITGTGTYCLYHGNMSVSENEEAALWLIENVFKKTDKAFVIAGKGISERLANKAKKHNVWYVSDPTINELNALIRDAQVNIIHSVNNTGVKLKLLHALFEGRHCIANTAGIEGSAINYGIHKANSGSEYLALINQIFAEPFTEQMIQQRKELLQVYNNEYNAQQLIGLLYSHYQ